MKEQAITPKAYADFIQAAVSAHGGYMSEKKLNRVIEEKYSSLWSETDKRPWGRQSHPKWKQNVASAKSALDRKGIIVRYVAWYKRGEQQRRMAFRVQLPEAIFADAWNQWEAREAKRRRRKTYEPLEQPAPVYIVPELD
jgi:hypothetical protein